MNSTSPSHRLRTRVTRLPGKVVVLLCVLSTLTSGESSATVGGIPVLTYHSAHILGNSYATNDHVALYHDLRTIHRHGFKIVPLTWVVEWVLGKRDDATLEKAVAIAFDDGCDFDYLDLTHPTYGPQRSFFNILRDFQRDFGVGAQPYLHGSVFVIASPTARHAIEANSYAGHRYANDSWWRDANASGLLSICSHSWDHDHPDAANVCEQRQRKGAFEFIDNYQECHCEIAQAASYIHTKISPAWPTLFAYPQGQASAYAKNVYFPRFQRDHHAIAAFGASGGYVVKTSPRWNLPRFVASTNPPQGWRDTSGLLKILLGAQ